MKKYGRPRRKHRANKKQREINKREKFVKNVIILESAHAIALMIRAKVQACILTDFTKGGITSGIDIPELEPPFSHEKIVPRGYIL